MFYNQTTDEYKGQALDSIRGFEGMLPHGSGFDAGCSVDMQKSTPQRIVIDTSFHHMDENGYYDGWTEHQVIITPCLMFGFVLKVTGRNRNQIKEYIADSFRDIVR